MTGPIEDIYTTAMRSAATQETMEQERKLQIEIAKREAEHWKKVIRELNEDIKRIEARKAQAVFELDRCIRESRP